MRNIFRILGRLAIVGNYSKTTALTEQDRATLLFIPDCVAKLIFRYFALAADVENRFVIEFCPARKDNYECYLFSSYGQRWKQERLSKILSRLTGWSVAQLRHILPGLMEHYGADERFCSSQGSVIHMGMGHSDDLGGRLYSRTKNSHSKLTNRIIHDTLHLCENWAGLLGFGKDEPQRVSGEDMWAKAHGVAYQEERDLVKVVKELLTVLTAPSRSSQNASDKPYLTVTGIQPALQVNDVEVGCASPVQALRSPVNNTHLPTAVLDDQDEPNSQDDILPDGPWLVGDEINPPLQVKNFQQRL